ncbi:hypothetical protein [Actinoplanes couchii]|uniref:Gram-positive cocci surface proteins LPxTG domain-containing protein n=1 Tax=Actinoplanes couchii TaxID=403638 RepID=A0ABQ3X281_9ACTN|nr:hypothetical protein [Actinoplanes couchii]MDR6322393.1 hypothetical protein [Actinoplanes couchii]GID52626.1 hypothetical protein Aco03nite_010300 [Actinoplanes couchii]
MPTVLYGLLAAALTIPAAPAMPAAATPRDCAVGNFTAHSQADLARIAVLNPGPLTRGLPALADVRLASATGTVDSDAQPYRSVASGRHADARVLGLPSGGAGAFHGEPSRQAPSTKDLASFRAAGLATTGTGRSTAHATWDDDYRCGRTGPLTRSATMLAGLSILDGMHAGGQRTSLLRIGPAGSAQSATDLIDLGRGRLGVRSGAGVALTELALFAGTAQQVTIRVVSQPTLEAISGGERGRPAVTYRPAVLEVKAAGKPARLLKDAGADVSVGLLGGLEPGKPSPLEARVSLGGVRQKVKGLQVKAEAETLRIEVRLGGSRLLDVALGSLVVEACAPDAVRQGGGDRPGTGGDRPGIGGGDRPGVGGDRPASGGDRPRPGGGDRPRPFPGDDDDDQDTSSGDQDDADSPDDSSPDDSSPDDSSPDDSDNSDSPDLDGDSPNGTPDGDTPSPSVSRSIDVPTLVADPAPAPARDTLALTGANVTAYGWAGGGLILAGLIALLVTRRRRPSNR